MAPSAAQHRETALMWAHNSSEKHMEGAGGADSLSDREDVLGRDLSCPGTTQHGTGDKGDVINVISTQVLC